MLAQGKGQGSSKAVKQCEGDSTTDWLFKPQASTALAPGGVTLCQTPSLGTGDCSVLSCTKTSTQEDEEDSVGGQLCQKWLALCATLSGQEDEMAREARMHQWGAAGHLLHPTPQG